MQELNPALSICIVVRNAASDLISTLQTIDRQSCLLLSLRTEVVIVDGYSTDSTYEKAASWSELTRLSVCILREPPQGVYSAMNDAFAQAKGEWLLFINAGDLLIDATPLAMALTRVDLPNYYALQLQTALFIPGASRAFWLPSHQGFCHQSFIYRRESHSLYGPYNKRLRVFSDVLFSEKFRPSEILLVPYLLSATQVSPANISRNPNYLRRDLHEIKRLGLQINPRRPPFLTLVILHFELIVGISLSVLLRFFCFYLVGKVRSVPLL